jgi:surface antigen
LIIQNPQVSNSNIVANSLTLVSFIVKNNGNANANVSYTSLHLSSDNIYQSGVDSFLKDTSTFSLAAGGLQSITMQVRIPANTAPGTWYILISANGTGAVIESDYTNNTSYIAINVASCYSSTTDDYYSIPNYNGADDFDCVQYQDATHVASDDDIWGFFKYQCVSYVAFKVNQSWGYVYPNYGFWTSYTSPILGNAINWKNRLFAKGYLVNTLPAVGAIAWWDGSSHGAGSNGHVAFVDCVDTYPTVITVSEYNWESPSNGNTLCVHGYRTIDMTSSSLRPDKFIHVEVGGLGSSSFVDNILEQDNNIIIYPNPFINKFKLEFESLQFSPIQIKLIDVMGQIVYNENFDNYKGVYSKEINLENKAAGVYFVQITIGDKTINKKLILQK